MASFSMGSMAPDFRLGELLQTVASAPKLVLAERAVQFTHTRGTTSHEILQAVDIGSSWSDSCKVFSEFEAAGTAEKSTSARW